MTCAPWSQPDPSPRGPVCCPSCRRPAARTSSGYLCACGAKERTGEPVASLVGELAEAQAEIARLQDEQRAQAAVPRVGVAVLLRAGPRLLMGLRCGPYGGGSWSVPGGKLERGEVPLACAMRELREETGIDVLLRMLRTPAGTLLATYDGGHPEWPDFVTLWAAGDVDEPVEAQVTEPEKCAEWRWVERNEVPSPLFRCMATLLRSGVDPWSAEL